MKTACIPWILMLLISTQPLKAQNSDAEMKFYTCIEQHASLSGIDLPEILDHFEKELISQKLLKDGSGKSYQMLVQEIAKTGAIPESTKYLQSDPEIQLAYNWIAMDMNDDCADCLESLIESEDFEGSVLNKLDQAIDTSYPDAKGPVEELFRATAETLPVEAYESEFIKMFLFAQYMIFQE
ncbi:MAG: hypothetical protein JW801_15045 [Bacteroidales bacterium]|nr:hypothetical protein [Bacteroidales bacterium]